MSAGTKETLRKLSLRHTHHTLSFR